MKESDFIDQNKEKWQHLEVELSRGNEARPDQITDLYIESVDDLSFARTAYPNRMVRAYLNGVVEVLSLKVQRSQNSIWKNIVKFWKVDLPLAMFEAQRQFLVSFLILAVSIGIGMFSCMNDSTFATYILGTDYVAQTLENIEKGDPMAIYKDPGMNNMFMRITMNNILVSARTYVLSLFIGFGTVLVMIYNGVMIGVFQYFFIERGLFFESFLTIWQHGVIEISCIVLAGAAGLVLAKGILFPASYSRLDSFRINGRKSLTIMMGIMPLLVLSGAIEAYVTRFTEVHWSIRLLSIMLSLSFIVFYFVVYPRIIGKSEENKATEVVTQPITTSKFSFNSIETNSSVFWESIRVMTSSGSWFKRTLGALLVITGVVWYWFGVNPDGSRTELLDSVDIGMWYLQTEGNILPMIFCFVVTITALLFAHWSIFRVFLQRGSEEEFKNYRRNSVLVSALFALLLTAAFVHQLVAIGFVLLLPLIGMFMVSVFHAQDSDKSPWQLAKSLVAKNYGRLLALSGFYLFAWFLAVSLSQSLLGQISREFFTNFVAPESDFIGLYLVPILFSTATLFVITVLVYLALHLSYYSLREIRSATRLTERIDELFPDKKERVQRTSILNKQALEV